MADLYISDSVYGQYVAEYGPEEAKAQIRNVVAKHAPGGSDE